MGSENNIRELQSNFIMPTYSPKLLLVSGKGTRLRDDEGKEYLDMGSGIGVINIGHCHPSVTNAICEQASKLVHISNLYMNEIQPKLAAKIIENSFDGTVFFANSGAEANEGLIKFARKYGSTKDKSEIIAMKDSFHGRTLATLAATGRDKYRKGFAPDMPGFKFVPFNDFNALKMAADNKTVAVLLEPVQGEGGVIPAKTEYLKKVRDFCTENDILLLFDEVQCGMGRTGRLFAFQTYGIEPDAFSIAKALGNGFPVSAFVTKRKFSKVLTVGEHASTFGGTPLACSAALAVLESIHDENILKNCREKSKLLFEGLNTLKTKHSSIKEVRGLGLMIGIVLEKEASSLIPMLLDRGLIALTAGENVLRLLPPLIISGEDCEFALETIDKSLTEFEKEQN